MKIIHCDRPRMTSAKYQIGCVLWRATFDPCAVSVTCPDCGGTGRLRVIFHDETQVSIECANCSVGYDPPRGYVTVHERTPRAEMVTVKGIEIDEEGVHYSTTAGWHLAESALFETHDEAMREARTLAAQYDAEERQRILQKEKNTRTWAWNASYHRRCIKQAQRDLDYHTKKLDAANVALRKAPA